MSSINPEVSLSNETPTAVSAVPKRRVSIKTITVIALFTAASCVLGVWAIPIGPISITLGLFAI